MARKVAVKLDLDAAQYLAEEKAVEKATKAADDQFKALGREVDATGRDMDQLAVQAAVAKKEVKDLGDKARGATTDLRLLDTKLIATKIEVKRLGDEFARTGDEGIGKQLEAQKAMVTSLTKQRAEIVSTTEKAAAFERKAMETGAALKALDARIIATKTLIHDLGIEFANTGDKAVGQDLGSQRSLLSQLTKLRNELVAPFEMAAAAAKGGEQVGNAFVGGVGKTFDAAPKPLMLALIPGITAAVAELLPLAGAMLGGIFTGAVGTAAMAGGLFAASRDPKVQSAAKDFGLALSDQFFGAGDAFVEPAVRALHILANELMQIDLAGTFAKVAPTVEIIAFGIADLVDHIMPGFNRLLERSGPFANVAAEGLSNLGTALGTFMDEVSSSPGAVEGLKTAFVIVNGAILLLGKGIHWLEDVYDGFVRRQVQIWSALEQGAIFLGRVDEVIAAGNIKKAFQDILDNAPPAGDSIDKTARAAHKYAKEAADAAFSTDKLYDAWQKLNGVQMGLDQTMLGAANAVDNVKRTFEEGTKAVAGHSQAVLENRVALYDAAKAAQGAAQAYITSGGTTQGAQKILDEYRDATIKATGATGGNKKAVKELADELFKLPPVVPVAVKVTFSYSGYSSKLSALAKYEDRFDNTRAAGGPVMAGKTYLVGENGPEIFTAETSGHIIPNGGGWQSASGGSGWQTASMGAGGGATQVALTISAAPGSDARVMAAITESLRFDVDTKSGGSVQVHLSRRRN